ncbi:MAG: NUDIX domain-containing protein [Faecalibacillus sp.]
MELLDIVDEKGNPTGQIIEREEAHQLGIRHRTSHVWILRKIDGHIQVLLQKRSDDKDSFPGFYDISSAGHIPAGVDFYSSALRELKEELGIDVLKDELIDCGNRSFQFENIFHHKIFKDNQVSKIFVLWKNLDESDFCFLDHEVSEVKWFDFDECYQGVKNNTIHHCIYLEELDMIKKVLKNNT